MEENGKKKEGSSFLKTFVTVICLISLYIFLKYGGIYAAEGIAAWILVGVLIFSALIIVLKPRKSSSKEISNSTHQSTEKNFDTLNTSNSDEFEHTTQSSSLQQGQTTSLHITSMQTSTPPRNSIVDKVKAWMDKIPSKQRPLLALGVIMVVVVVIIISITFVSGIGIPDTTITGTWTHEIGDTTLQDEHTWVMNLSNWNVDTYYDTGIIYMYVNEDGTFTVFYNDMLICQGTWEASDNNYVFHQVDPEGILLGMYSDYEIKGLKLYEGINAVFEKE